MIRDHFSLNAWHPFGDSQFWLIRVDADWSLADSVRVGSEEFPYRGWFAVTVALLGFGASLTFWPESKGDVPSNS